MDISKWHKEHIKKKLISGTRNSPGWSTFAGIKLSRQLSISFHSGRTVKWGAFIIRSSAFNRKRQSPEIRYSYRKEQMRFLQGFQDLLQRIVRRNKALEIRTWLYETETFKNWTCQIRLTGDQSVGQVRSAFWMPWSGLNLYTRSRKEAAPENSCKSLMMLQIEKPDLSRLTVLLPAGSRSGFSVSESVQIDPAIRAVSYWISSYISGIEHLQPEWKKNG